MGWLRLVGSLRLQVSFAEFRLVYRALLQKRRIISRSLLIVATPFLIVVFGCYMREPQCVCMHIYTNIFMYTYIWIHVCMLCMCACLSRCICISDCSAFGVSGMSLRRVWGVWVFRLCMGWLRLVGSLRLQVSFAEFRLIALLSGSVEWVWEEFEGSGCLDSAFGV